MRLASFSHDGADRIGAEIDDGHVVDLTEALAATHGGSAPADMLALIRGGETALAALRTALDLARAKPDAVPRIPIGEIRWHPPVRRPGKVLGVAMNNSAADARKVSAPDHPAFFMKPATCLLGHNEPVVVRDHYGRLHPEPELAVVVGKTIKDYDPRDGDDAVFGYAVFDDLTGNDMRSEDRVHYFALYPDPKNPDEVTRVEQHLSYTARYKGTDCFGPFGPWLVTKDDVPDPHALDISCSIGGEMLTDDNTRYYTYTVPEVLAFISRYLTLEAGDVISMGTAFRASKTGGRPLHTGDMSRLDGPVEVTISGLGTLSNPVERVTGESLPDWRLTRT
jgi:2-keto-4-pentenoate hydratase/2-oxohepta-3-ene-1,7-dioic acid hydratase in catechol pathway